MRTEEIADYEQICQQMLTFMHSAPINLFFKDSECRYRFVTDVASVCREGPGRSILGMTDLEVQACSTLGRFYYEDDLKILHTGAPSNYVSEVASPEGTHYFEIRKNPVYLEGKITGIVGIVDDITSRIRMENELKKLSFRDTLTGLYNRTYLDVRGNDLIARMRLPITVIMGDCNYLKEVNDNLGHDYGDLLIKRVARVLRATLAASCPIIRIGGDEFLILCDQTTARQAEPLIRQFQAALQAGSDDKLKLDVAFGYHTTEKGPFDLQTAYHLADQDMYQNKHRNR